MWVLTPAWAQVAKENEPKKKFDRGNSPVTGPVTITPDIGNFWQRVDSQKRIDPFISLHLARQAWRLEDYSTASLELKRFSLAATLPFNDKPKDMAIQHLAMDSLLLDLFAAYSAGPTPGEALQASKAAYGFGRQITAKMDLNPAEQSAFLLRYKQMHSLLQADLSYAWGRYAQSARQAGIVFGDLEPNREDAGGQFGPAGRNLLFLANLRQLQREDQFESELTAHQGLDGYGIWPVVPPGLDSDYRRIRDAYLAQPKKSKALAVTLATLLPGSGHWYLGRGADAIASFGTVAVLGALSAISFASNSAILGTIFGAGASAFYAGNIYGAWRAADSVRTIEEKRILFQLELRFRPRVQAQ